MAAAWLRGRVRRYEIAERSMAPTLLPGDYVLATAVRHDPMRGDILIIPHPEHDGFDLVKRVVGLPGERVAIRGGQVYIDRAVLPEAWALGPTLPEDGWVLGPRQVFLLGDQRAMSSGDSRTTGPIGLDQALWSVAARYWPPGRIGLV